MKTFINLIGAKSRLAKWIVSHFPPQDTYSLFVDVFGGSAALLLYEERPNVREVFNDLDHGLVTMFEVARTQPEAFKAQLDQVLYSRMLYRAWRRDWLDHGESLAHLPELEQAVRYFALRRWAFSGWLHAKNGGFQVPSRADQSWHPQAFRNAVDRIPEIAKRLANVVIENLPYEKVIERSDGPDVLLVIDPPYSPRRLKHVESKHSKDANEYYCRQWTEADDDALSLQVQTLKSRVIICGYAGDHFTQLFPPPLWRYAYKTVNVTSTNIHHHRDRAATEVLAMNYEESDGHPRRLGGLE